MLWPHSEGHVVSFIIAVAGAITRIVLGFYGFWLLACLACAAAVPPQAAGTRRPGRPFVGYFTDPFINPVAERLHLRARLVSTFAVVVVASASAIFRRMTST